MERSLLVQMKGKAPDGSDQITVMDYINATREIEWVTNRMDAPGKLKFSCVEIGSSTIPEGSSVEYTINGEKMFKGYVFTLEQKRDGEKTYTIYDQLRYLKAKASYAFTNMSLEQIIMRIAGDFGLKVGTLDSTGYVFPSLLKENEECIDIIFDALSQTIIQTGKIFIFYDKAGELTLTEVNKMFLTSRIGDGSLATDYTYKRDIDSDTYNRVKLVRKNEKSGRTDVYVHEDTETIKQWGLLQYYDEVDKSLNEAQIDQMCAAYLQYYNRVLGQFTRNYTQTVKRAADNKRRYAPGWVHSTCLLRGFPKGAAPHLAHDFAEQSVVCYTLCRRCPENTVAAGEGKGI